MRLRDMLALCAVWSMMAACVSSSDYKMRLSEIDGLREEAGGLRKTIAIKESELAAMAETAAALKAERDALAAGEAVLKKENDDIRRLLASNELQLTKEMFEIQGALRDKEIALKRIEDELGARDAEVRALKAQLQEIEALSRRAIEEKSRAVSEMAGTYEALVSEMKDEIEKGRIEVKDLKGMLTLSMVDRILFDSGRDAVNAEGKKVLDRVAKIIKGVADKQIRIEGHTDNVPIGSRLEETFPTNWHLSAARAANVVRYLHEVAGLDPARLSAAGYGEFKPVASNETREGKARNRRIEIVLLPIETERVVNVAK